MTSGQTYVPIQHQGTRLAMKQLPVQARIYVAVVIAIGAGLAWGRWRGRAADVWLVDIALFTVTSYRVAWNCRGFGRFGSVLRKPLP